MGWRKIRSDRIVKPCRHPDCSELLIGEAEGKGEVYALMQYRSKGGSWHPGCWVNYKANLGKRHPSMLTGWDSVLDDAERAAILAMLDEKLARAAEIKIERADASKKRSAAKRKAARKIAAAAKAAAAAAAKAAAAAAATAAVAGAKALKKAAKAAAPKVSPKGSKKARSAK